MLPAAHTLPLGPEVRLSRTRRTPAGAAYAYLMMRGQRRPDGLRRLKVLQQVIRDTPEQLFPGFASVNAMIGIRIIFGLELFIIPD